jgi:hypothetical protein
MPTIESLSPAGLDYLRAFNLACIAISPTGRVYVSHNPAGASLAWWCKAEDADKIVHVAWANADVPGAASRLGLTVTPHSIVLKRVTTRTERIDAAIAQAKADGLLQRFHQEYKQRRLEAKARGAQFMGFGEAERRLRKLIADSIADGGTIPQSFTEVFDQ